MHTPNELEQAQRHSIDHGAEIKASTLCGCFYCLSVFGPGQITKWIDDDNTALCPKCGIDSVIGDPSGVPITTEFLAEMERRWFGIRASIQ